jgi:1,4-dihydroxy-2-naphthoate octaprenyltransferase
VTGRAFLRVSRPPTLAATVVPMVVGGTLAWVQHHVVWWAWAAMVLIGFAMQIGVNMLNEYYDYVHGLDDPSSLGIGGIIVTGEVPARTVLRWAVGCYTIAFVLGLSLVIFRSPWLLLMGILAIAAGYFYASGPWPISSTPFGELFVFLIMGPLEIAATELATLGQITAQAWLVSLPVGLLVASILLGNNLRDRVKDGHFGRRTIPVVLGAEGGFVVLKIAVAAAFLSIIVFAIARQLPVTTLLVLLAVPLAIYSVRMLTRSDGTKRAVPILGRLHIVFGLLLSLGIILSQYGLSR